MIKKQILFVIDSLACGGAERSFISLLPKLDQYRAQIHLMMVSRGGVFEQYLPESVGIVCLPSLSGVRKAFFKVSQALFSFKMRLMRMFSIRRHGAEIYWQSMRAVYPTLNGSYDVAIAYHQGFPTYYVADKVKAHKKIAWVNTDMNKAGYRQGYNRKYYDRYDYVVAVSDIIREQLCRLGYITPDKISTIYDINDVDIIREMAESDIVSTTKSASMLRIATVGRIVPVKNFTLAVMTGKELKRRGIKFVWSIVGDGSDRQKIEELIKKYDLEDEMLLIGMHPNPYPYIAQCDIYVNTSLFEGFGLTLAEARILHKPVITTDFPAVYNQIKDGENGFIVPPEAASLADAIIRLSNDRHLYAEIVSNLKKEENFTPTASLDLVESLLYN